MQWADRNKMTKYCLALAAVAIAAVSLIFSDHLVSDLEAEAESKMSVWAEAMKSLNNADETTDLGLVLKVIDTNSTIPIIVRNERGEILQCRNLDLSYQTEADSVVALRERAEDMLENGYRIQLAYASVYDDTAAGERYIEILYDDSTTLKRLAVFPYVQIGIAAVFVFIMIFALLSSKRAEQNRVWVGLSKETAHQLGTPISSLMGWMEMLRDTYADNPMIGEMQKDVNRLQLIAERFSKVGSKPELKEENLQEVLWRVADYIDKRSSNKVQITCDFPSAEVCVMVSAPLFEWVIENLCKNAIDAMSGKGRIHITVHEITGMVIIELSDTGKGIPKKSFKTVFAPGYTTKKRGWGLGLSLAKRIVEKYHDGRIFVKSSEIGRGTTFRIELRK